MAPTTETQNQTALTLRALHVPGNPLILANIWDCITATTIGALPSTTALATASYAIAAAAGLSDPDLTLDVNLRAVRAIASVARSLHKPLTVDFQDGFGDALEPGVRDVIRAGAVGINLEDFGRCLGPAGGKGALYDERTACARIRAVMRVAAEEGVPDFVVNARTDALLVGGTIDDAIARGKAYLEAGAFNVFIWGGLERPGTTRAEIERAAKALGGRLNVILKTGSLAPGGLTVAELSEIGVARISVGPQLMMRTKARVAEEAERLYRGEMA